jgi:hypothetical protein
MASASLAGGYLRLGDVFSRAVPVWSKLIGPFAIIYVVRLVPTVMQTLATQQHRIGGTNQIFGTLGIAFVLSSLIGLIAHSASVDATMRVLDGGSPRLMEAIDIGMRRFFPLLGAWIIASIIIGFGFVLLVAPGIIVAVMLFLVTPVCVVERLGPIASLERSIQLTKGARWKILGIFLVFMILAGVSVLAAFIFKTVLGPVAGAVASTIVSAAIGLFSSIVTTITYAQLASHQGGFGGQRIAAVFD